MRHHRRSIRLRGYDYTRAGAYFVTICASERACLFGEIVGGVMRPNDAGALVLATWNAIPDHHPGIDVDEFVVMPNHVHGIVIVESSAAPAVGAPFMAPLVVAHLDVAPPVVAHLDVAPPVVAHLDVAAQDVPPQDVPPQDMAPLVVAHPGVPRGAMNRAPTVGAVYRGPTLGTVIRAFKARVSRALAARVWQRNYYEHVVRDEESLHRIRQYIRENPARWALDRENPAFAGVRRIGPNRGTAG